MKTLLSLGFSALAAVSIPAAGCYECTLVGCDSSVTAKRSFSTMEPSLVGAKVQLCRGTRCVDGTLEGDPTSGSYNCTWATGTPHLCIVQSVGSGELQVDFEFFLEADKNGPAEDGESFAFTIASPADPNVILVEAKGDATFEEITPNGESCDPVCDIAEI